MSAAKVARHPLAFGITYWGPLPDTTNTYVMWDGPGSGLYLHAGDPARSKVPGMRIRHQSASGTYGTVRAAERAVLAFVAAGSD